MNTSSTLLQFAKATVAFLLLTIATHFSGAHQPLTTTYNLHQTPIVLITFCLWLWSLLSWGRILSPHIMLFQPKILSTLVTGTIFFIFISALMAHFSLLGDGKRVYWILILCAGIFLNKTSPKLFFASVKKNYLSLNITNIYFSIAICLFLLALLLSSVPLNPYQDPYVYHLYAPWIWWRNDHVFLPKDFPIALMAYYWEYLNLWSFALLGSTGTALFSSQIFCQILHSFLGVTGTCLALIYFFRSLRISRELSLFLAITGCLSTWVYWTAPLVKNDYGGLFLLFSIFVFLMNLPPKPKNQHFLLVGILIGITTGIKFTLFISAMPFYLYWIFFHKKEKITNPTRSSLIVFLGFSLSIAPLLIRNYVLSGNPVFPFFSSYPLVSQTFLDIYPQKFGQQATVLETLKAVPLLLFTIITSEPLVILALFLSLLSRKKELLLLSLLSLIIFLEGILLMKSASVDSTQIRFFTPALIFCLGVIGLIIKKAEIEIPFLQKKLSFILVLLLFFQLAPHINATAKKWMANPSYSKIVAETLPGGSCKIWIATNTDGNTLSIEEDAMYLMPEGRFFSSWQSPKFDNIMLTAKSPKDLFQKLKQEKIQFILLNINAPLIIPYYRNSLFLFKQFKENTEAQAYRGSDCLVMKIKDLEPN